MARLRLVVPAAVAALALAAALAASGVLAQQSGSGPPTAPAQAAPSDDPSGEQFGPGERRRGQRERGDDRRWDRGNPDDWAGGDDRRSFEDYAGWYDPDRRRWQRWEDDGPRRRRDAWGDRRPERWGFEGPPEPRDFGDRGWRRPLTTGPRIMDRLCGPNGGRMIGFMLDRLERMTNPVDAQRAAFDRLKEAAAKAQEGLRTACPSQDPPVTPPGRLAAAEKRLEAMLEAIRTVRPPLDEFYASLSEEQKARLYAARPHPGWREHILRWRERFGEGLERRRPDGDPRDSWRDQGGERRQDGWREQGDRSYDGGRGRRDRGERWRDERDEHARPDRRDYDRDGWPDQWRGRS